MADAVVTSNSLQRKRRFVRFGRSRFSWVLLGLVVMVSVTLGVAVRRGSFAATTTTVSGRLTDSKTGYGLPNVTLSLCHSISVVTNATGGWSIDLPVHSRICVVYVSGAPSNVTATAALNLPPDASVRNLYEYQITGINCYHNKTDTLCDAENQAYDRGVDTGYDMTATLAVPYVPSPSTPTPVPTAAPVVTAVPATATPRGATTTVTPKPTAAPATNADAQPPTVPGDLKAESAKTNAVVNLSWQASTDNAGPVTYELERRSDGGQWHVLSHDLSQPGFQDTTVAYSLTYAYRVRARDGSGNTSAYTTAAATTPVFVQNTSTSTALSFTSDDGAATLYAPAGAVAVVAQCSVVLGGYSALKLDSGSAILAGPYQLICKNAQGAVVTAFSRPVTWTITPRNSNLKLASPHVFVLGAAGRPVATVSGSKYDAKAKTFTFTQTKNDRVMVLASQQSSPVVVLLVSLLAMIGLVLAGLTFWTLQRRRIARYRDYLRDKYYNM